MGHILVAPLVYDLATHPINSTIAIRSATGIKFTIEIVIFNYLTTCHRGQKAKI